MSNTNKEDKCCWRECENVPVSSLGNNLNKGTLDMCQECLDKWEEHQKARERLFLQEGFNACKKRVNKIIQKEILEA